MRLIDADVFAKEMKVRRENAGEWLREAKDHDTAVRADAVLTFLSEVKLTLDKIPTIDAVPVVRCQDCKYYEQTDDDYEGEQGEDLWGVCSNTGAGMMRCGYCSYGERKDDEEQV